MGGGRDSDGGIRGRERGNRRGVVGYGSMEGRRLKWLGEPETIRRRSDRGYDVAHKNSMGDVSNALLVPAPGNELHPLTLTTLAIHGDQIKK